MEGIPTKRKKIAICFSGGLDSFLLWKLYEINFSETHDCVCVFYNIGQPYYDKELLAINQSNIPVTIRNVEWLTDESSLIGKPGSLSGNIIIPGRNAVLATLIATQELPDEIWMGALQGEIHEKSTDKNYTFVEKWNSLMQYVLQSQVTLKFPFADMGFGKFEVIEWALLNKFTTPEELMTTSSCLSGNAGKCGECVVCFRRWGIFHQFNLFEGYTTHPLTVDANRKILLEMIEGELGHQCHYDAFRRRELVPAALQYYKCDILQLKQILS